MDTLQLKGYALTKIDFIGKDVLSSDCDIIVFLLDNCEITIDENSVFFGTVNTADIMQSVILARARKFFDKINEAGFKDGFDSLAYTGMADFSHTTTQWKDLLSLGIVGVRDRIAEYEQNATDPAKRRFYSEILRVWNASLRFLRRAEDIAANAGKNKMSNSLKHLVKRRPLTLYEAMQTIIVYYNLQMFFDGTFLRTLGRIDSLLYPFYKDEDKEVADSLLVSFLREVDKLKAIANIPFSIGGTDEAGLSLTNDLSIGLIDAYGKAGTHNTKFHILYSENMPDIILKKAFSEIRAGNNSIVFMNDSVIIRALLKIGEKYSDAVDYHVVGCYECGGNGELTCSCNGRINIPKALEVALGGGKDALTGKQIGLKNDGIFPTFEDLYTEFKRQLKCFVDCAAKCTDIFEKEYRNIHSAPILSATYQSAMDKGGDLYCDYTAVYNNSSINAVGLGTAVDSLVAIKKAVYDDKVLSLDELRRVLSENWVNDEVLRLTIKNKYPKWGNGIAEADKIGKRIVDDLSEMINGRKNEKGGVYRLGMFSIDWRWYLGEKTAASADGRKNGDTLSQNSGATFGAEKNSATAHFRSVASIDAEKTPNATIVDIDFHSSAVEGKNGLDALISSLKGYFKSGGFAVHYNVLNTEMLKKAYLSPEKYPDLQVRLCGWNVLFSSLTKREQEEFIMRSKKG